MSFQSWWRQKSRRAKTITILATLLVLEIGLCFSTPVGLSWSDAWLGTRLGRDPFSALGYMFVQAVLAGIMFLAFLGVVIFYRPSASGPLPIGSADNQNQQQPGNDENR